MLTMQKPIPSGFAYTATPLDVLAGLDLSNRVAVVTGGYAGIGLETTRALAAAGARVIVPARSPEKAARALTGIPHVTQGSLDLLDPTSIASFARDFLATGSPLHMLINNAGIMATPLERDARGFESQFSANHLGHFQLTAQLMPALLAAGGARVVSVSSRGHRFSAMNFEDPNFNERLYDRWLAYGQPKTANILFAAHLDSVGKARGVRAFSLHPGRVLETDLSRNLSEEERRAVPVLDDSGKPFTDPDRRTKTTEQGASTTVWCAVSGQLDGLGGVYCEDCDIAPLVPADSQGLGVRPYAIDPVAAEQLWGLSEKMIGMRNFI